MEYTQMLTVEDLQKELPAQDYETLTLGDETVAVRALLKAKVCVKAMVLGTGNSYDELNEICLEATLKWALYELFGFCGQEQRAREKQEDCELLIERYFGPVIRKNDSSANENGGPAYGVMNKRKMSPLDRSSGQWG